jgi:hypothetical protein
VRSIISPSLNGTVCGDQIPIARAEPLNSISRTFLPWRFSDAGPAQPAAPSLMGPATENLHISGRVSHVASNGDPPWARVSRPTVLGHYLYKETFRCSFAKLRKWRVTGEVSLRRDARISGAVS